MPHNNDDKDEESSSTSTATLLAAALQQATSGGIWNDRGDNHLDRINTHLRNTIHSISTEGICKEALDKMKRQVGGFYVYSLYDDCTYSNPFSFSSSSPNDNNKNHLLQGGLNDYPCGTEKVMALYLSLPQVQKALHVRSDFFEVDNAVGFDYTPTYKDVSDIYRQANAANLKVLVLQWVCIT